MKNTEILWSYACNGNIEGLKSCHISHGNSNCFTFGKENSLIMGALRNNQFETVDYLLSIGCTITEEECEGLKTEIKRLKYMEKLCKTIEK